MKYAVQNELFSGTTATTFEPNTPITRGMVVTVLFRAESDPAVNKSVPFADVKADSYYANAVIWAEQNGIVTGTSETTFAPNDNITREQLAAIMLRFADILSFDDFADISEYAIPAMQYAAGAGLINGKSKSTLNPKDGATRAEAAAILQRFLTGNNL